MTSDLRLDAAWLAQLRARADRPPPAPRLPLRAGTACIGSVEPRLLHELLAQAPQLQAWLRPASPQDEPGWCLHGELDAGLGAIAHALRAAGLAGAWRDELLAVTDEAGRVLGRVERGAVRPLGIATRAVHLLGTTPDGRHWVQRRALDKPNDPGLLDTLVGGMVPASDTLQAALARETLEEAGLRVADLHGLRHGGHVTIRQPSRDGRGMGYVVERIDWFQATVPQGLTPVNQDGEVSEFLLLSPAELARRLHGDEFTLEAALLTAQLAGA